MPDLLQGISPQGRTSRSQKSELVVKLPMKKSESFDKILNKTLAHAKKIAKEFYFNKWSEEPPKCPAFEGEIVNITREGWEHTVKLIRRT